MVEELIILQNETIFDTEAHYIIPRYQRAYAWEDKEIIQLIDDINSIDTNSYYYIGSLVVSKIKEKDHTYEVVDGQQRLTTLYLLFQYLVAKDILEGELGRTLSFDCRVNSDYTLSHLQSILKGEEEKYDIERVEQSLINGIKVIRQKFESEVIDFEYFVQKLQHVILYRVEVPENTDLNRYFEIMNTRGEQLEQHDILKARLMKPFKNRKDQELFSRIWEACSDMTGYVQMHFSRSEREGIFGSEWRGYPSDDWETYRNWSTPEESNENIAYINEIVSNNFSIVEADGTLDDNTQIRFESIIDFTYFLLHAIRLFVARYEITMTNPFGDLLDDKKLIVDFEKVLKYGVLDSNRINNDKEKFSKLFIIHLLQTRWMFDKFIIKREYTGEDNDGEWSLKELFTSGQGSKKKAYYINTKLNREYEREKSYAPRNKEFLMIQAALRVSYTSPKIMHWLTELIRCLFIDTIETPLLVEVGEEIAALAVKENFLDKGDFKLGVSTPHIVFNFLDYLLWKRDKNKYKDFEFEFRNSVEHWYPQNPSDGSFDSWDDVDTFGNLCILSRNVNSKFSNLSPESKMKSYGKIVNRGSLKLRIMGEIIQNSTNEEWVNKQCQEHGEKMITLLQEACSLLELIDEDYV